LPAGAFGFSTGLVYAPSAYSDTQELIALAKSMAARGGYYFSHIRGESSMLLDSINEAIRIGDRLLAEQDRVHEGENRGGGANGEAKDQHRRGGKAPVAHETPDPVARIAHERVPGGGRARVAGLIAHSAFAEARVDKSALL